MVDLDFRLIFESTPGLYLVLLADSPRYTIVAASDLYLQTTMTERAHIVGKELFDIFPDNPADASAAGERNLRASLERVRRHLVSDAMAVQKYDIRRPASLGGGFEERYWSPVNAPVLNADGGLDYIIHRVEDVTELVRLEHASLSHNRLDEQLRERTRSMEVETFRRTQQLEETNRQLRNANDQLAALGELQLRALFDCMPQLGWAAQPDGFIDFYNRGWYDYTGTSYEQMKGWGWQSLHHPDHLARVIKEWTDGIAAGQPLELEFPLRRHDGVFRWFLTRVNPIRNSAGNIVKWVGINTDIHEQKRAGAQSEMRLSLLVENIRDYAIIMLEPDGRVAMWNAGAERIQGYRADEIIGKSFTLFYPEEDVRAGKCEAELAGAAAHGRFEDEGWRVRKDGSRFWANVIINAVRDSEGKLLGFAKVTRDRTETRLAELERSKLIQAEEAIKLRDEFLSIASHELRTPLTTLQLELQSAVRRLDRLDDRLAKNIKRATSSGDRLTSLVETLFDVSRISTGRLTLHTDRFDLAAAFAEIVDRLRDQAQAAGCQLSLQAPGPVVGTWDRMRLEQVLTNLVANALKYAAGGRIQVSVGSIEDAALFTVTDDGPGIAAEALPRIFERFERAAPMRHFGGLGLGLYIVKQIVEAHGGSIAANSSLGHGSSFTVRLPLNSRVAVERDEGAAC